MAKLKTGRHTSGLKAQRQAEKHAEANRQILSKIRTIAKGVEDAVGKKDVKSAKSLLQEAFSVWDKAAKTGLVHASSAARKKARLSQRVSRLETAKA